MQPTISVIMSVYNAESHLRTAVKSILDQTFTDFEFIIIEDCSTDDSRNVLLELAKEDSRIKLIFKDKNEGTEGFIKNLNIGLKTAKGKYIARMDADDISLSNRFEKQLQFLEKNNGIYMVGSNIELINESNQALSVMKAPEKDAEIKKEMPKKISMFHPVIMFRNDNNLHYREKMRYCEDYDLYLRAMTNSLKMANLQHNLLQYRVLDNSMSRKQDKVIKNLFINKVKEFYKERLLNNKDSYDTFSPDEYLNIYINPSQNLVRKSIIVSKKYHDYEGFIKMLKIYGNASADIFYIKNKLLLLLGKSFFNLNSKFLNKLEKY